MASYQDLSQHLSLQYSHGESLAVCILQVIKNWRHRRPENEAREGLVKLIMYRDVPECWMKMWRSGTFHQKCHQDGLM